MFHLLHDRSSAPAMSGSIRPLAGSGMALDVVTARSVDLGLLQVNGVDMSTASNHGPVGAVGAMAHEPAMAPQARGLTMAGMIGRGSDLGQLTAVVSLAGQIGGFDG